MFFFPVSSEILWLQIFLNYRNTVKRLFGPSADFDNDLLKSVRDFASCCEGLVLNHGNPTTFLIWPFVMCLPHSSPIGSFGFFSLMTASLTYINKSLETSCCSSIFSENNKGMGLSWSWNCLSVNCPVTLELLTMWGYCMYKKVCNSWTVKAFILLNILN